MIRDDSNLLGILFPPFAFVEFGTILLDFILRIHLAEIGHRTRWNDSATDDQAGEGTGSVGATGEAEEEDLVAGGIVVTEEVVGGADVGVEAVAKGTFRQNTRISNQALKWIICLCL